MKMKICIIFALLWSVIYGRKPKRLLRSRTNIDFPADFATRRSLDDLITIIVTMKERSSQEDLNDVSNICGHSVGYYLGEKSYTMKSSVRELERVKRHSSVQHVGLYKSEHRYLDLIPLNKSEEYEKQSFDLFSVLLDTSSPLDESSSFSLDSLVTRLEEFIEDLVKKDSKKEKKESPKKLYSILRSSTSSSHDKLMIRIEKDYTTLLKKYLSEQNEVHLFQEFEFPVLNNRDAKWVIGTYKKNVPISSYQGEGEIIAVGDSGIDMNNCFFHDYDHSPESSEFPPTSSSSLSNEHRKILHYWEYMDNLPRRGRDHGSHVSGTISGNWANGVSDYNGISPKSKLVFTDLGCNDYDNGGCTCEGVADCVCSLFPNSVCPAMYSSVYTPMNYDTGYFNFQYLAGARISSNSWGNKPMGYFFWTADIDRFVWENRDFLPVFSVGNAGYDLFYSSLTSESECKNCVSVGSSENSAESWKYFLEELIDLDQYKSGFLQNLYRFYQCDKNATLFEQCSGGYPNPNRNGVCEFLNKLEYGVWSEFDCCDTGVKFDECNDTNDPQQCGCQGLKDPVGFWYSYPNGNCMGSAGASCCSHCIYESIKQRNDELNITENLADYSSLGPSWSDGRIKPDIVAPGDGVISAYGTSAETLECNPSTDINTQLLRMTGSSFATPSVAGAISLIREYLVKYHKISSPTASLMKALVISSGEKLFGSAMIQKNRVQLQVDGVPELQDERPIVDNRYFYGFGRLKLDNVILDQEENKNSIYFKEVEQIKQGKYDYFCYKRSASTTRREEEEEEEVIQKNGDVDVKITLVWTDYPSVPSKKRHLVNDLNLIVKMEYSQEDISYDFWMGNEEEKNVKKRDRLNNVEQVEMTWEEKSSTSSDNILVVIIEAYEIIMNPQGYAIVVRSEDPSITLIPVECEDSSKKIEEIMVYNQQTFDGSEDDGGESNKNDVSEQKGGEIDFLSTSIGGVILAFNIIIFVILFLLLCCICCCSSICFCFIVIAVSPIIFKFCNSSPVGIFDSSSGKKRKKKKNVKQQELLGTRESFLQLSESLNDDEDDFGM